MKKATLGWVELAEGDIRMATVAFEADSYHHTVFFCHLAIERLLKACLVEFTDDPVPPYTHNLRYLVELAGLTLSQEHESVLSELSPHGVAARYPQGPGATLET